MLQSDISFALQIWIQSTRWVKKFASAIDVRVSSVFTVYKMGEQARADKQAALQDSCTVKSLQAQSSHGGCSSLQGSHPFSPLSKVLAAQFNAAAVPTSANNCTNTMKKQSPGKTAKKCLQQAVIKITARGEMYRPVQRRCRYCHTLVSLRQMRTN